MKGEGRQVSKIVGDVCFIILTDTPSRRKATANAQESLAWGTNIVGGVTPGKDGEHLGLPVLPTVREVSRHAVRYLQRT
jgi:succinyl-CoA synthetase alpha subunit